MEQEYPVTNVAEIGCPKCGTRDRFRIRCQTEMPMLPGQKMEFVMDATNTWIICECGQSMWLFKRIAVPA